MRGVCVNIARYFAVCSILDYKLYGFGVVYMIRRFVLAGPVLYVQYQG